MKEIKTRNTYHPEKTLSFKFPKLLEEWDYDKNTLDPTKIRAFYNKDAHWTCKKCNHNWITQVASRAGENGTGCPKCNISVKVEDNFIDLKYPHLLKDWDYKKNDAAEITIRSYACFSHKKAHWKCHKCEFEWERSMVSMPRFKRG